jgi:hypothetical protein
MLPEHAPDLSAFSESGLFSLYRAILRELKSRGVIRTENAPVGDYAEYLVATAGAQLGEGVGRARQQWREAAGESSCRVRPG